MEEVPGRAQLHQFCVSDGKFYASTYKKMNGKTGMTRGRFVELFTEDKPVIFAFHGCQRAIHEIVHGRHSAERLHVWGSGSLALLDLVRGIPAADVLRQLNPTPQGLASAGAERRRGGGRLQRWCCRATPRTGRSLSS